MINAELYERIIESIRSGSLKKVIKNRGYTLSELDLLRAVCACVDRFDERIALMGEIYGQAESEEVRGLARACIEREKLERDIFEREEEDTVYELHIKTTPDSYDERYLCDTLELAKATAKRFYSEYECLDEETELTEYSIAKRHVRRSVDIEPFEDYRGSATYKKGMVLSRVWETEGTECDLDNDCEDCSEVCHVRVRSMPPKFPSFIGDGECLKFTSAGKVRHAIRMRLDEDDDGYIGEYYIIPLDGCGECESIDSINCHEHLPLTDVETMDEDELTEREKETAKKLRGLISEIR